MIPSAYRVSNWNALYENNRTKEIKRLLWVPVPNSMDGAGYTELVDHPNGAAHFGAWIAILEIASRQEVRGEIPQSSAGTSQALARISRLPVSVFDEVFPRLLALRWVEPTGNQQFGGIPQEGAGLSQEGARNLPLKERIEGTEGTEKNTPTGVKGVKALTPHQLEMKRLKDLGWKGVAKTTDAACEKIIVTIRETDFAPSSDLKSAYMIFTRLCWFVEFAGYFWECGAGPDQRRAREMYFEMVPDIETKELVEAAIEAQAPAMLEREKKFRTQPHNWLKARSWEAAKTLFGQ